MHIVIIGNGISGTTAARWVRKLSDHKITIISSESKHFYSRTALMYVYMGHMRHEDLKPYEDWFWEKNRLDLVQDHVTDVDFNKQELSLDQGGKMQYDKLVLALGSKSNKFGWPGQDLKGVGGLYHLQDLEQMEAYSDGLERAVITGGGLIGIEMAEMFQEEIPCGYVGLTAGVSPNVGWLKETDLEIGRGIKVNNHLETNQKNVYAIGDCAELEEPQPGRRGVEAIWYTGRMMGETVAYNICDKPVSYDPGIWFNSAKFIDIEYQVYGAVPAAIPETMATLYWEHADHEKAIRINYDKATQAVLGFNLMGVRYRHEVCEKWIRDKMQIEEVLQHLGMANFDPEFYKEYESDIIDLYNKQTGSNLKLKSKRGLKRVLAFLSK